MKTFDLWVEGYLCTGCEGIPARATRAAQNIQGENFLDAVRRYVAGLPTSDQGYWSFRKDKAFQWGCQAFPTEREARESYG